LLELHRSGIYYTPVGESEENLQLMRKLDERHLHYPTEGVLQLQDYFRDEGLRVNHKRIRRLMRKMGIRAQYPRRTLTKLGKAEYIHPYLLRNRKIERPNEAWAIDITYIPMKKGFMYLAAIIDLHSRYVVAWSLSNSMTSEWVCSLVKEAVRRHGKPEIINSDQGSQFTCREWIALLQELGIKISMDGKGRAIDNVFIERLWRTVKYDYVYLNPAQDGWELEQGLRAFFYRYNFQKSHQGIGRRKPASLYLSRPAA